MLFRSGLTGFYNYGYGNTTPDNMNISTPLKATNAHFERIAAMLHYAAPLWNLVGEFDYGQNAFNLGNLFFRERTLGCIRDPQRTCNYC